MSNATLVDWAGTKKIYPDLIPWGDDPHADMTLGEVLVNGNSAANPTTGLPQDATDFKILGCETIFTGEVFQGNNASVRIGDALDTLQIKGATNLGSIIVGNGLNTEELVCPTTTTTATTGTIYNWLSLANGQSRDFFVSDGTLYQLGYSITIVYSGSDSITGTITAIAGNLITLTIVSFTSQTYVPTTLISTTPPDPTTATSGGGDPVFIFNPAVCTPTTIPANSFLLTGLCYLYGAPPVVGSSNISLTAQASPPAINGTTNIFSIPMYENPPVSTSAFNWGTAGCFIPDGTSVSLASNTGGNVIAFAFPSGGSFIDQDFTGSIDGYALPYSPDGVITINSKLVLTADNTKPLGVFWGVDAQGVGTITSVSAGNNISVSGSLSAPVVNVQSPLTATLALGTQNITGSSSAITLTNGGSVLNETSTALTITNATDNTTFSANGVDTNYLVAGVAGANADLNTNSGNAQLFMSSSNLTGGSAHSLQIDCPLIVGNCDILHSSTGATTRNMDIATEGSLGISAGVITIPTPTTSNTGITINSGGLASNTLPTTFNNSNVGGQANPLVRLTNTNATGSVAMEVYKNKPTAGVAGDVLFTQSVYGKDSTNAKQEYTRISHTIRDATAGAEDGSMELGCFVNGAFTNFIQLNANDAPIGEVNFTRPLDFIGGSDANSTIKTSGTGSVNLNLDATSSAGTGHIVLKPKLLGEVQIVGPGPSGGVLSAPSGQLNIQANTNVNLTGSNNTYTGTTSTNIQTPSLVLTGAALQSGTSGGSAGTHLVITLNGTVYKIALLNP